MATGKVTTECIEYQGRRNSKGYGVDGHGRLIHRKVVESVEGPLLPGQIVMHLCDNPPCCRYDHLRRATQLDNIRDRDAKGRRKAPQGEASPNAKLNAAAVAEIRATKGCTTALARKFGVSTTAIKKVRWGQSWRQV